VITPIQRTVIILLLIITTFVGLFVWRMTSPTFVNKESLQEQGVFLFPQPRDIPPMSLIDQNGRPFTSEQLKGKWSFIFFGFTSCGEVCPTSLSQLSVLAKAMSEKSTESPLQYIFFSIDPKRDTPQKIAEYVNAFNKDFIGVTGLEKDLPAIGSALNVVVSVPKEHQHDEHNDHKAHEHDATPAPAGEIDHSANVVIINPKGQYHGFIRGGFKADDVIPLIPAVIHSF
jgi:protein SCO1/2